MSDKPESELGPNTEPEGKDRLPQIIFGTVGIGLMIMAFLVVKDRFFGPSNPNLTNPKPTNAGLLPDFATVYPTAENPALAPYPGIPDQAAGTICSTINTSRYPASFRPDLPEVETVSKAWKQATNGTMEGPVTIIEWGGILGVYNTLDQIPVSLIVHNGAKVCTNR